MLCIILVIVSSLLITTNACCRRDVLEFMKYSLIDITDSTNQYYVAGSLNNRMGAIANILRHTDTGMSNARKMTLRLNKDYILNDFIECLINCIQLDLPIGHGSLRSACSVAFGRFLPYLELGNALDLLQRILSEGSFGDKSQILMTVSSLCLIPSKRQLVLQHEIITSIVGLTQDKIFVKNDDMILQIMISCVLNEAKESNEKYNIVRVTD